VNFHNVELRAWYFSEEGNAFYNAITYDPSPAAGAPAAAPEYYALLLLSRFARARAGCGRSHQQKRSVGHAGCGDARLVVQAAPHGAARLHRRRAHSRRAPGALDRRAVPADGSWPGFGATHGRIDHGRLWITVGAGEAVVVTPTAEREDDR
jgi:hypothetical protein